MPSRQSTLTGRYPHATGVTFNGDPLPDEENTIAEILNKHGEAFLLAQDIQLFQEHLILILFLVAPVILVYQ